jgi:ACS family hexuronate transporter-like MFS transporter
MSYYLPDLRRINRGSQWRWWVCGLLLLATAINYMDRLTLNLLKVHILSTLQLDNRHYGAIEGYFGLAFAVGAVVFGFAVDRWNVFWVYPVALAGWCAAGFFTAFSQGFYSLLAFRMMLGFFEAANWPCALRTTQHILTPGERSMGNSLLQSGAAVGAILIPLVLWLLFDEQQPTGWRLPFMVVGAGGVGWILLWLMIVQPADLSLRSQVESGLPLARPTPAGPSSLPRDVFRRRFVVLIALVVSINMTWHFLRAWLPSFLMEAHSFNQNQTNFFSSAYYVFTDLGALSAGFATLYLARRGVAIHASRRLVFLAGASLAALCLVVPFLPPGWPMIVLLLVIGFGSLGVFPCYYSFTQDLTVRSQGKVTGALGACCWGSMYLWQNAIGQWVHHTKSYTLPFVIAGLMPLGAFAALALLWGPTEESPTTEPPLEPAPVGPPEERILSAPAS